MNEIKNIKFSIIDFTFPSIPIYCQHYAIRLKSQDQDMISINRKKYFLLLFFDEYNETTYIVRLCAK